MHRLPNLLSASRIVSTPLLLALAWQGAAMAFLLGFALALLSDVLDGMLARFLHVESEFGARLDQWADFALWLSFPLAAWWLWPQILLREAPYVGLAIACLLGPTAIAWLKYREVPGYHTWTAKTSAVLMGIAVPTLVVFDFTWPFRGATILLMVAAVDELGITLVLPSCQHDVPSLWHAFERRRAQSL
ncbi:CDP-alcohol phosphatidyltransferase family protein [Myxococcota bacterium]|nr:CDP-alcohol phosphatidyltransferase family protein [Myxococcota bacterium]